jgi:hypothetical protein
VLQYNAVDYYLLMMEFNDVSKYVLANQEKGTRTLKE